MPRGSSGTYSQPASDVNPPIFATVIDPVAFAASLTDIATELTNSLDRLGRGGMLGNLQMGGFKISGLASPAAPTDAARLVDIMPSGAIVEFAMNVVPFGYLECDGSAISRSTQSALFAAIGITWGAGDGSTTFNIPDFRGEFRRGWDHGKGTDPARAFGTFQAADNAPHTHIQNPHNHLITDPNHTHTVMPGGAGPVAGGGGAAALPGGGSITGASATGITINNQTATNQTQGVEGRPRNWATLVCIRT